MQRLHAKSSLSQKSLLKQFKGILTRMKKATRLTALAVFDLTVIDSRALLLLARRQPCEIIKNPEQSDLR